MDADEIAKYVTEFTQIASIDLLFMTQATGFAMFLPNFSLAKVMARSIVPLAISVEPLGGHHV